MHAPLSVPTVANVRFEQDSYTISENVTILEMVMLEICVVVDDPFERPIMVRVSTMPGTATGNSNTTSVVV